MTGSPAKPLLFVVRPLIVAAGFLAARAAPAVDAIDFARDIQPLLAGHCYECHGADKAEGGLRLHDRAAAVAKLDSGESGIVPGHPDRSAVIARVSATDVDERMPPREKPGLAPGQIELLRRWITAGAEWRGHWAFQPLASAPPPEAKRSDWARGPLDRFIQARLEAANIAPAPEADRATLIKRLSYDLLGLPPSVAAVDSFLADTAPDAYERLVERLLSAPQFGERWGRHWLDMARYADSDGYEKDNARPDAWRYRDWVVRAINDDLPFDEFSIQQLAGDLFPNASLDQRLATAFLRQTLTNKEGGADQEQFRVDAVFDRTETLGTVWLGLTLGCARCHSHKYDQLTQREYYQIHAYFNNGDETTLAWPGGGKEDGQVRVVSQRRKDPRPNHVLIRGDFLRPGEAVTTGGLAVAATLRPRDAAAGLDRLDLARWLFAAENPLPARVAVNHVWQALFGQGLVRTPDDFGVRGEPPTHPELLDWLAAKYRELGWSRKALIRLIVTSAAYRQSSQTRPELAERDPNNLLVARQNRFRVEAELVRDLSLSAAGLLSAKMGGPCVFPPMPAELRNLTYAGGYQWKTSAGEDRYRRGMYTFFKRTAPDPNLVAFDCPDANLARVKRDRSNTPVQALTTLNNEVFVEAAQAFAALLLAVPGSDDERLTTAFRRLCARAPHDRELAVLRAMLAQHRTEYARREKEARGALGKQAFSAPPAEAAAWVATARVLLNLDEFLTRE